MPGGACCYYGVCCPPERQAMALANHLAIPLDAARKVAEGFLLVPRSIEAGPEAVLEGHVTSAQERLAKLHRYVKGELRAILIDLGHAVEEA